MNRRSFLKSTLAVVAAFGLPLGARQAGAAFEYRVDDGKWIELDATVGERSTLPEAAVMGNQIAGHGVRIIRMGTVHDASAWQVSAVASQPGKMIRLNCEDWE